MSKNIQILIFTIYYRQINYFQMFIQNTQCINYMSCEFTNYRGAE